MASAGAVPFSFAGAIRGIEWDNGRMPEHSQDHIETVSVRRAPKISVFLVLGAALGVLVAMILTFAFNGTAEASPNTGMEYSQGQVFGLSLIHI